MIELSWRTAYVLGLALAGDAVRNHTDLTLTTIALGLLLALELVAYIRDRRP